MRFPVRLAWFSFATCAALAIRPAAAADPTPLPPGSVIGQVLDREGHPLAGATVQLEESRGEKHPVFTESGPDGQFRFTSLPAGEIYRTIIDAPQVGREFRDDIFVFPASETEVAPVRMKPGCVLSGRVLGPDGTPRAGVKLLARLRLHELGHTVNEYGNALEFTSGADGRFATPPLPACYVSIESLPPAGLAAEPTRSEYIVPGVSHLTGPEIQLVAEAPLTGIVADPFGNPVAGAEITCVGAQPDTIESDPLGQFTFHGLTPQRLQEAQLWVEARGFATFNDKQATGEATRRINLTPCGYISGRVIDAASGEPVQIKTIVVCEVRRDADGTPRSHGCGEVRFDQPTPGEFTAQVSLTGDKHLTILADGYQTAEDYLFGFDLKTGAKDVTLKVARVGSGTSVARQQIRGRVTRDGQPVPGTWVALWRASQEWDPVNAWLLRGRTIAGTYRLWFGGAMTDDNGEYSVNVADPGEYYVVAREKSGAKFASEKLHVTANETLTCDLPLAPLGTIRGQVAGASDDAADHLWVVAFAHTPYRTAVPVDREGNFTIPHVPAGEIGLKVGHEGYIDSDVLRFPFPKDSWERKSQPWLRATVVNLSAGETRENIELTMPPAGEADRPRE